MDGMPRFASIEPTRVKEASLELEPKGTSLDFLQMVYRNASLALATRMRAAMAALPFEAPKLAVTAVISEHDFATLLDQRIQNMERINNGNGSVIETKPVLEIETRPPKPHIPDRRFRRI
jgi:hypothetical protein